MSFLNLGFIREVGYARWGVRTALRQFSKRVLRRDNVMTLPTGLTMRLPRGSHFGSEVFVTNANVDWGSEALFVRFLDPAGAFLDVGSHIGYYALYVRPRVAHVFAFEPDPRNLPALSGNLGWHQGITIVKKAVSSQAGHAGFVVPGESAISHLQRPDEPGTGGVVIQVDVVTLDDFTAALPWKITGIKIDVEGFDFEVLKGAVNLLRRDHPLVLTEAGFSAELLALCGACGYSIYAFTRDRRTRRVSFSRIEADGAFTKMLFLVPERLEPEFRRRVSDQEPSP
jgi:FkbM family methyltransferase